MYDFTVNSPAEIADKPIKGANFKGNTALRQVLSYKKPKKNKVFKPTYPFSHLNQQKWLNWPNFIIKAQLIHRY